MPMALTFDAMSPKVVDVNAIMPTPSSGGAVPTMTVNAFAPKTNSGGAVATMTIDAMTPRWSS